MNNNEKAEVHSGIAWAIIFALAAITMGVIATATKCPRSNLDFDYLGLLVGILSLLVTALIGWQVYNAIELRTMLNEMSDMKVQFDKATDDLAKQDQRNISLIEAFHKLRYAEKTDDDTTKYLYNAEALKLFLEANMPLTYDPFVGCRSALDSILNALDKHNFVDDKIKLARKREAADKLYHAIIDGIHKRQDDLSNFRDEITRIRDRRLAITKDFENKETSFERTEREKREAKEAELKAKAEQDKQSPDTTSPTNPTE